MNTPARLECIVLAKMSKSISKTIVTMLTFLVLMPVDILSQVKEDFDSLRIVHNLSDLSAVETVSIHKTNKPRYSRFDLTTGEEIEREVDPELLKQLKENNMYLTSRTFFDRHESLLMSLFREDEIGMTRSDDYYGGEAFAMSEDHLHALFDVRTKFKLRTNERDRTKTLSRTYYFDVAEQELYQFDSSNGIGDEQLYGCFSPNGELLLYSIGDKVSLFNTITRERTILPYAGRVIPVSYATIFLIYNYDEQIYTVVSFDGKVISTYHTSKAIYPRSAYAISESAFIISSNIQVMHVKNMIPYSISRIGMYTIDMIEKVETQFGAAFLNAKVISVEYKE
ncbi:MAG: hypothetical protein IH914_00805 [candidate division Zixibacteria bacterium]|nr:hypothetical protein [candidate division Zixibacteria bacterium]